MVTVTVMGGGYPALHESLTGIIRLANSANVWRFRMCRRLSVENILLERLAQHLEHVAAKRRQLIPKDHAMVGQRHFAWRRHLAPFDQAHIRDGVVRGPTALLRLA